MPSLGLEFQRAARLLRREFDRQAPSVPVTVLQWRVLEELAREDSLIRKALRERLEEAGLIRRETDASDRRAKRVRLTAEGERLVGELREQVRKASEAVHAKALAGLDKADRTTLVQGLARIGANLDDRKRCRDDARATPFIGPEGQPWDAALPQAPEVPSCVLSGAGGPQPRDQPSS